MMMANLVWRIGIPLVVFLILIVLVAISEPISQSPSTVICSTWYITEEDTISIVDYLCDSVSLPDFARYVFYNCPIIAVAWSEDESPGIKVDLDQCAIEEPGWR